MPTSTAQRRERLAAIQLPGTVRFGSVPTEPIRRIETGIPALDAVLGGGLPRGCLSEIVGAASTGRTAFVGSLLAATTRRGEVTAVVDLPDALHPESLWAVGVDMGRLLWVRPPSPQTSFKCVDVILAAGGFGLVVLDLIGARMHGLPFHVWPRLVRLAKQSRTALVVLAQQRVTGSFSTMSVVLTQARTHWGRPPWRLFDGMTTLACIARNKLGVPGGVSRVQVQGVGIAMRDEG